MYVCECVSVSLSVCLSVSVCDKGKFTRQCPQATYSLSARRVDAVKTNRRLTHAAAAHSLIPLGQAGSHHHHLSINLTYDRDKAGGPGGPRRRVLTRKQVVFPDTWWCTVVNDIRDIPVPFLGVL